MFICLEGVSASGKTTQLNLLKNLIERNFYREVTTSKGMSDAKKLVAREFSEAIGASSGSAAMGFIYCAALTEQRKNISEMLKNNKLVLTDRWAESFFAYLDLYPESFRQIAPTVAKVVFADLEPDLTIFLDIDPNEACQRYSFRARYDTIHAPLDEFKLGKVRAHYASVALQNKRWVTINVNGKSIDNIHKEICAIVQKAYELKLARLLIGPSNFVKELPFVVSAKLMSLFNPSAETPCYLDNIGGGYSPTSKSFKVTVNKKSYVFRYITTNDMQQKWREALSYKIAASKKISPRLRYCNGEEGMFVVDYIENDFSVIEHVNSDFVLSVSSLLRSMHSPLSEAEHRIISTNNGALEYVTNRNNEIISDHFEFSWQRKAVYYGKFLSNLMQPFNPKARCHADLHPWNLLYDVKTKKLYAIDWEFVTRGDPLFDVLTIVNYLRFSEKQEKLLLQQYYMGTTSQKELLHYQLMKIFTYLFWAMGALTLIKNHAHILTEADRDKILPFYHEQRPLSQLQPLLLSEKELLELSISLSKAAYCLMDSKTYNDAVSWAVNTYASLYPSLNKIERPMQNISFEQEQELEPTDIRYTPFFFPKSMKKPQPAAVTSLAPSPSPYSQTIE